MQPPPLPRMLADLDGVLAEIRTVFAAMPVGTMDTLTTELLGAGRIFVYGVGRNGLVLQAFAMRLMHLGLDGHFVGQLNAPPAAPGDIVLVAMALGSLPTADAVLASAKAAGARTLVITARPDRAVADVVLTLPAQTMADPMTSLLPLGSPFELSLAVLCDLAVVALMRCLGHANADLARRHTNLL